MAFGDKPAIVARDAAEAAAIAKQASDAINAVPGVPGKDVALRVLGGITVVGGIVSAALTAGTVPAIVAGVVGLSAFIAGLFHSTPAK